MVCRVMLLAYFCSTAKVKVRYLSFSVLSDVGLFYLPITCGRNYSIAVDFSVLSPLGCQSHPIASHSYSMAIRVVVLLLLLNCCFVRRRVGVGMRWRGVACC